MWKIGFSSKTTTVVLIYSIVLYSNCASTQTPLPYVKCDDTSWILNYYHSAPTVQIMSAILTPLDDTTFPSFFNDLKDGILYDIQRGLYTVDRIIDNLPNLAHLNSYDLLISTLIQIKLYTNAPCPIKQAISKAVLHLMLQKYLPGGSDLGESFDLSNPSSCHPLAPRQELTADNSDLVHLLHSPKLGLESDTIRDLIQSGGGSCGCQSKLLSLLLGKMIQILPDRPSDREGQTIVPNIMEWLQPPTDPAKLRLFNIIVRYFASPEGQDFLNSLNLNELMEIYSPQQIIEVMFNAMMQQNLNDEVVDAIRTLYYNNNNNNGNEPQPYNDDDRLYMQLLSYIPRPLTDEDQGFYNLLRNLLENPHNVYLTNFTPDRVEDLGELYKQLLNYLVTLPNLPEDLREAVEHYLAIIIDKSANRYNYSDLIDLLPRARNDDEERKYDELRRILESGEVDDILKDINPADYKDKYELFEVILQTIIKKTTITEIKEIVKHIISIQLEKRLNQKYIGLLELLPHHDGDSHTDEHMFMILKNYFDSDEINAILRSFNATNPEDRSQTLLELLRMIGNRAGSDEIKDAGRYYLSKIEFHNFFVIMQRLLKLLPTPTAEERSKYEMMTSYLQSPQAFELMKDFDLTLFDGDDKFLLEKLLKRIIESTSSVSDEIIDACKYYVLEVEKLGSLNFVTKKQISKSFKLTDIFADTLELKKMNMNERVAFKRLFKYISKITPGSLDGFDSWDQAKTRGQFIKLFFDYLLKLETVPQDIRDSIIQLDALVRLDGNGALPP